MFSTLRAGYHKARDAATAHEGVLTLILASVAVLLLLICVFGKPGHKVAALVYIVL